MQQMLDLWFSILNTSRGQAQEQIVSRSTITPKEDNTLILMLRLPFQQIAFIGVPTIVFLDAT